MLSSTLTTEWMKRAYKQPRRRLLLLKGPPPHATEYSTAEILFRPIELLPKFLPNFATIIQPLNDLLQKNKRWSWSKECTQATKQLLNMSNLLMHYNPLLPLHHAADASQYGLGAVILHTLPSGEKRIAFASRALSKSKRNYLQIDKEALVLVYGV